MASISAADYTISFREGHEAGFKLREAFEDLYMKDEILVSKRSKKSCRELDIKPYIYAYDIKDDSLSLRLSCGSVMNIKPELVMEALYDLAGFDFNEYALIITRTELYSGDKDSLVPLDDTGLEITMTEDGPFALS